jgi:uncharacterized caspase-like protein
MPKLRCSARDAEALKNLLVSNGYTVLLCANGTKSNMQAALARFIGAARSASMALVYFSGHGVAIRGEQYLAPVDGDPERVSGATTVLFNGYCLGARPEC